MTTRKDLQKWLNRFPEDTIIEFGIQQESRGYESYGSVKFDTPKLEDNNIGEGWEFLDFRNNQFVNEEHKLFGKCYLQIGESR